MRERNTRLYLLGMKRCLLGALLGGTFACAEALPRERPEAAVGDSLIRAERAAESAARSAAEVKGQIGQSQNMAAQIRDLTARLENAERQCRANYERTLEIQKAEAAARARRAKVKKPVVVATPVEAAVPVATPEAPPAANNPDYSPSDAP